MVPFFHSFFVLKHHKTTPEKLSSELNDVEQYNFVPHTRIDVIREIPGEFVVLAGGCKMRGCGI